ncbi:MAG TPA: hypothetical protein VGZ47_16820 [Gemmataceae bacterium]|jgi:hypothetical protein|nr:hypothetical protein [Gemmataceae bacterium]
MKEKMIGMMFKFSVVLVLLLAMPSLGCAFESIDIVTKERAKELGVEIRWNPAGPDAVRVVLEFETKGELKSYTRVELAMHEGDKLLMSSTLREEEAKPGHVVVSFAADRKKLPQIQLRVVTQNGGERTGYEISVKDFVDLEKLR